ncbi:MAG: hypothetical protein DSZ12_05260, partial [Sulfurovum sp.]
MNLQKNSLVERLIKIVNIAIAFAFLSYIPLQAFTDSNNLKYANNESFEKPVIQGGWKWVDHTTKNALWYTTEPSGVMEFWKSGNGGIKADSGNQFIELNAKNTKQGIYQYVRPMFKPENKRVMYWRIAHRGRNGIDTAKITFGAPNKQPTVSKTMT